MKHIFIVNPTAGKKDNEKEITDALSLHNGQIDYEIYKTKFKHDATQYIRKYCESHKDEETCFYACGGDGTLNEVINGVIGFENAYVSIYACGSGNDFVKYYGGAKNFLDIENLVNGTPHKIDAMQVGDKYAVNIVNFGFDTCVVKTMEVVKRKPIIGGSNSYYTGVATAIFTGMKNECTLKIDGKPINEGDILLCTVANGQYVGGSFRCAPRSLNDDGMLDVCYIDTISRLKFISLIKSYSEGTHLDNPKCKDFVHYRRCEELEVVAPEGFIVSLDGELHVNNHFTVRIVPKAINFIVPRGATSIIEDGFAAKQKALK